MKPWRRLFRDDDTVYSPPATGKPAGVVVVPPGHAALWVAPGRDARDAERRLRAKLGADPTDVFCGDGS